MQLLFGHFADFATLDQHQKLILVGIFDMVTVPQGNTVGFGIGTLVVKFRASVLEGERHTLELRITDADGADARARQTLAFDMAPEIGGVALSVNLLIPVGGMVLPHLGEYAFRFYEGERQVGEVPIQFVTAVPRTG